MKKDSPDIHCCSGAPRGGAKRKLFSAQRDVYDTSHHRNTGYIVNNFGNLSFLAVWALKG